MTQHVLLWCKFEDQCAFDGEPMQQHRKITALIGKHIEVWMWAETLLQLLLFDHI